MRKFVFYAPYIFLLILFLGFNNAIAQTEFAPIGAEWYFSEPNAGYASDYDYDYQRYISKKDTLIDGKTCRLITNRFYPSEIIYGENGSVYYYYLNGFRKIFDFTAKEGDTIDFEFKCNTLKSLAPSDTVVTLQCVVESITTETVDGNAIKTFQTVFVENEELDFLILPVYHNYTEIFGRTRIRFNEFIPVLTGFYEPAIYGYRNMRCYHDHNIDYIASWWKEKDKPCDEPFSLSIKDYDSNSLLNIYPNPAKDKLNIQFSENFNSEGIIIAIYDEMGKLVSEKEYFSKPEISIDISNLSIGYYLLKINNKKNKVLTHKFIKL